MCELHVKVVAEQGYTIVDDELDGKTPVTWAASE